MDFSHKSILHIDHFTFAGVNAIKSINLSNNSISIISQAFNQFIYNFIYTSGPWAPPSHFKNLLDINLSNNKISSIDTDSFLASFCETLDLGYNSLTNIHSNQLFTKFVSYPSPIKLKTLKLNNNKIHDISPLFMYESNFYPLLIHVYLQFNLISKIESNSFSNVKSLTHLYLNDNQISSVSSHSFEDLENLIQIHLYNNPITYISPDNIQNLVQVTQVCKPAGQYCMVCLSESCTQTAQIFDEEYLTKQINE
jgi:Leucine-rich repeat (LRR) protein